MAHGLPDWTPSDIKETVYAVIDLAELGVRLGAISSIDRLGNVIFFDDFSNGLGNWISDGDGTGHGTSLSGEIFRTAGFAVKLVGGSDSDKYEYVYTYQIYSVPSKLGFEISFNIDSNVTDVQLVGQCFTGSQSIRFEVWIDKVANILYILDSTSSYVEVINPLYIPTFPRYFSTLKLVGNLNTGYYTRLNWRGNVYDISDVACPVAVSSAAPLIKTSYEIWSATGTNAVSYLDNFILTQNEP
jgi:hypothetical protein